MSIDGMSMDDSGLHEVFREIWAARRPLMPTRLETTLGIWLLNAQIHSRRWAREWRDRIGPLGPSDVPVESAVTVDFDAVQAFAEEVAGRGNGDPRLTLPPVVDTVDDESPPLWRGHLLVPLVRVPSDRVLRPVVRDEDGRRVNCVPVHDVRRLVRSALLAVARHGLGNEQPHELVGLHLLTAPVVDFGVFVEQLDEHNDPRVGEAVRQAGRLAGDPLLLRLLQLTASDLTVLSVEPSTRGCRTYIWHTERSATRAPGA